MPELQELLSELHHSYIFQYCLPIIFFVLLAQHGSPMLPWCLSGSVQLIGMHLEPTVTAEVFPAVDNAYPACAADRFLMFECVPRLNAKNLPCLVFAIMSLFVVARSPEKIFTNPQFGP